MPSIKRYANLKKSEVQNVRSTYKMQLLDNDKILIELQAKSNKELQSISKQFDALIKALLFVEAAKEKFHLSADDEKLVDEILNTFET